MERKEIIAKAKEALRKYNPDPKDIPICQIPVYKPLNCKVFRVNENTFAAEVERPYYIVWFFYNFDLELWELDKIEE